MQQRTEVKPGAVPRHERWIFAAGDVFGGSQSIIAVLYLVFLTDVVGVSPAWAGAILLLSKAWDAVSDPLMGLLSDRSRTRYGRRRPWIGLGALLIIPAMAMMWYPHFQGSQWARILYMAGTYLLYNTVSTIIAVPYSSLSTEISTDVAERGRLNLLRLLFSLSSTALCTLVPSLLFERLKRGQIGVDGFYLSLVLGAGLFFAIPLILVALFCKERGAIGALTPVSPRSLLRPFGVRAFRSLLVMYLAQTITLDIVAAVILYYALYVVAGLSSTVFLGLFLGMQLLLFPLLLRLIGRVPKPVIYRTGLPLAIAGAAGIAFYPAGASVLPLYLITALTALGFAGAQTMCWVLFPDIVDVATLGLGERIAGAFSGVMTLLRKASSAIALFVIGQLLHWTGFVRPTAQLPRPAQPATAILGIRLTIAASFLLLMGWAWFVARRLALTPAVSEEVRRLNARLEAGEALTPEEEAQRAALVSRFVD